MLDSYHRFSRGNIIPGGSPIPRTPPSATSQVNDMASIGGLQSETRSAVYGSAWPLYALDWSGSDGTTNRLAVGTVNDDPTNKIEIIDAIPVLDSEKQDTFIFEESTNTNLTYPCTNLRWATPNARKMFSAGSSEILASSSDAMRLWDYYPEQRMLRQRCLLTGKSRADQQAPVTQFDWNSVDPSLIISCSVDTTCTIWDLNTQAAKTQLIAHDREVYDVKFATNSLDIFMSAGADGSVRVFDIRALEHSTIIYEPPNATPLLRLSANHRDPNLLATFNMRSSVVYVLDIRSPGSPLMVLDAHKSNVNAVQWAPHQRNILATASDDTQILIWDTSSGYGEVALAYSDTAQVNNISWNDKGTWLGYVSVRSLQGVKI